MRAWHQHFRSQHEVVERYALFKKLVEGLLEEGRCACRFEVDEHRADVWCAVVHAVTVVQAGYTRRSQGNCAAVVELADSTPVLKTHDDAGVRQDFVGVWIDRL
jgi:hypothetical protein